MKDPRRKEKQDKNPKGWQFLEKHLSEEEDEEEMGNPINLVI